MFSWLVHRKSQFICRYVPKLGCNLRVSCQKLLGLAPAYRNAHGSPPFLISFCTGLKVDGAIFITWQCYRWLSANFDMQLGHVWIWAMFVYWSQGLFLWMVQRKSRFRNLKRVDGRTQEFVSGTFRVFQVCKFQFCLLAKYLISGNGGGCSHINFVQTAIEEKLLLCCVLVSSLEWG